MSKPEIGSLIGIVVGALLGVASIIYFELEPWLDRICLIGSTILVSQLLGATFAAALGKPHDQA